MVNFKILFLVYSEEYVIGVSKSIYQIVYMIRSHTVSLKPHVNAIICYTHVQRQEGKSLNWMKLNKRPMWGNTAEVLFGTWLGFH